MMMRVDPLSLASAVAVQADLDAAQLLITPTNSAVLMEVLNTARLQRCLMIEDLVELAGVSASAWHQWRGGSAVPRMGLLLCFMEVLGFELVVQLHGTEIVVQNVSSLMRGRFDARRRMLGVSTAALAAKANVSAACWSAVSLGRQSPKLSSFVRMANALGFEVLLRQRA